MKIPKNIINEIRQRADIVDVIGEYVNLKPAGRNWKGLCPFHHEKTPSFTVNRDDGYYYCFGCKETGSSIHFIMKHLNFTFVEAVKFLAERYNIKITENITEQENTIEQIMYKLYDTAREFYTKELFRIGEQAAEYFQGRNISDEMIIQFGLGYSPNA
jgi:DNA primase